MPTVFASVSVTILLFYILTLGLAYAKYLGLGSATSSLFPFVMPLVYSREFHMIWGLFVATLIVLLQCLIFGFFIGSGKSIKRVVSENGLSQDWVQKTKDYKNQCYPALMLAILVTAMAAIVGGGVAAEKIPVGFHQALVWLALALNARSLWISYKVVRENVSAIHRINALVLAKKEAGPIPGIPAPPPVAAPSLAQTLSKRSANYYFLAMAVWVPYLYMRFSLGSRNFPFWPFAVLSGLCLLLGLREAKAAQGSVGQVGKG